MKTAYTPGPWKVHIPRRGMRKFHEADGRSHGDTGIEILSGDGKSGGYQVVVGHVNCQPHMRILTEPDARLIAAAPELLEALELAIATINRLTKTDAQRMSTQGTHDVARIAINKAKGIAQ